MSSNSITHFISTAKDLSDLLYIEKFFEKHSLTPLSLENGIVNDLERLFDSVLNTPIPNNDHMKGLFGIVKCLRQISLCKDDEQWLILHECVSTLINKCASYIMTHLDVNNILFSKILQLILQIIIDSSRHHISIKNKMLQCLSPLIFDIIINKKPPLALEKLCIQSLTMLVTRTDQERRKEVMELVYPKLAKFFDHLYTCGDYDTQLCIVETILRFIVPDKNRKMFFVNFKHKNPNVIRNFLNIRSKDFDTDCRIFLNHINKSQGENALVISVPCYTVLLNETIIEKPPEQELFWVDFNRGALSVSIWCNKNSLLTPEERTIPDFVSSTDWQLLIIKPEIVTEVKVKSIKPSDEVQRNFIEIQFVINSPLEIRPLEEIICTQSKCVRMLFPRSKETEALEEKVLPTIFKMRKLDGMYKQNKVNDELDRRNKYISSAKVRSVGKVESTSFNNVSRMPFSKEERCQKLKETDESVTKEKSKILASGRKISTTKTKIEFQSFLDSDEEKKDSPKNTSTKQVSEISGNDLNHRKTKHSDRVDEAESLVAGRSLLDNNINQEENNDDVPKNKKNEEEDQKFINTNTKTYLNSTKPKTRCAKISITVEKCSFFEQIPEQCHSMKVHCDNESLNNNNNLRISESTSEIHGSTKDATDISHKNLSKQEFRTEVADRKMSQNLNANYAENPSEKEIRESKSEFKSNKENVEVSRSINTCQLHVPANKIDFSSSNQNVSSPPPKENVKEIGVSAAIRFKNIENKIEDRTIKISESSKISDKELNHRKTRHSEGVDGAKSSFAGQRSLDKNINQEENNEDVPKNKKDVEENKKIIKTNTKMCLNPTKQKIRYAKISTTEKCNFFERIPENCHSMNFHCDNESLNNNNNLRIGERTPEIHGSTKEATDIFHKNLSKQELSAEVANGKMNQNLNANYAENLSEKEIGESKSESEIRESHNENVKVSRSINTCQLDVPANKINFSSSKQNLSSPPPKVNVKEIDESTTTSAKNSENRIEERRTIKISTSADKCIFNLKKAEKKDIFPQSLNKNISSTESRKENHLLQPNNTENQQTSKYQDCNIKMSDLNEFLNKSKYSENSDKRMRRISNSLHTCLFEDMEKNTRTQDALNHTDILAKEISDKMMSKVNINEENIDKSKIKEAKNVDLNHKFRNSEKKMETNSLSPKNKMSGDKKYTKTDEVVPYTVNENIHVKETSKTIHTDSGNESRNSKIKEIASGLLPSIEKRSFKTSECSQKQSLQINSANKIKNERGTEQTVICSRKQSQFNLEKGATMYRRSKRIQNARRQSENIFESSAINASRKREEKQYSDNDFDEKKYFKNTSRKRLQTIKKEKLRKDFISDPCISDKYIDRNKQKLMNTGIANKVQFEDICFKRKLKKDIADNGINKIQDMHASFSDKRNEICENLCKSPQDERVEIKYVSKPENNNYASNCKSLVPETLSSLSVENCINLPNEETADAIKTSISVNENNHNPKEEEKQHSKVKHPIENTGSESCSLKKYRKPVKCEVEACESSFQTCSSGTEVTEGAEVNDHNMVHNNSKSNNNKMCLQEGEKDMNLSNELSHAECVNLTNDCKEVNTKNRECASKTVITIESESQGVFVQNEIQENPNSENKVNNTISDDNEECDTKEEIAQLSPCSQSDVSHIVTNAIVHNLTQSVKVFKFFTQNITSVEKENNDTLHFQDKNEANTTKHIANALVKDSVEKVYIQETVTSKRQSTNCYQKGKAAEAQCEDSNEINKVKMIRKDTRVSTKEGKTENFKTKNSPRKKKNLLPVSRSDVKPITLTRTLRKRKAVSYTYNSPLYAEEENKGKHEVNNSSHNKMERSSVKKRLFTQNEEDIVSLCSGSQNSCLAEKVNMKEIPLDTKNCDSNKSRNNNNDEFDKLRTTSPPPLPKRNPNHWKEKYRKDIQLKSLKQTSSNQKIVNSKKMKLSVYSDLDSSSDMSVFSNNADHDRKAIAAEDREKTNFVSLIKIKDINSEKNSKSKDPQSVEKNALFHLNPNNTNDTLQTNKAIFSPKVNLKKLPSTIEKERNFKVSSENPENYADEIVMDTEQGFQEDVKVFVKNSIMDVEPEKMKTHSKYQIKSENNKEIDCKSKIKDTGEQIIQQGNSDKLVYTVSTYDNKKITQTGKSINNKGFSEQLQLNVNCSLAKKAVFQDTDCENKTNESFSVQQKKEAQNKENIKFNESIDKSNQKDLCKKKRKYIVYSDTDSDHDVSVSTTTVGYQSKETCTLNLQIKKSNEYFSENEKKGFQTNKQKESDAFQCNENYRKKSICHGTKCNTLNTIDHISTCREQELQISPIHSKNEKENSHEITNKCVNDAETVEDQRIIGKTPLKWTNKFENKRKKPKHFRKLIRNNEISPLFLENRLCNKKFLNIPNPKCQLEINGKLNIDDDDDVSVEENGFSNQETSFCAISSIKSNKIVKRQSKGQIQSKKCASQLGYKMHKNHIGHRFPQKPLVSEWSSETDESLLSSTETINEFSEKQSTSVRKIKKSKPKTSFLKHEFQKTTRGKKKCIKEFSSNISNALLGHYLHSSNIFHAKRADSRKHLNNNIGPKIEEIKNSIQTLDGLIEGMEKRIEEVNGMVMNQNYIEEDIKQNFIHIEKEYMKFAADLSNEPKFDIQHLISSLGEKFRKETLRNMLKKVHDVCDTSL